MLKYWFLLALCLLKFVTISILAVNPCDAIGKSSKNLTNQTFIFVESQGKYSIENELILRTIFKCHATGANIHYIVMQDFQVKNVTKFGVVETSFKNGTLIEKEFTSNVQFIVSPAVELMFTGYVKHTLSDYFSIDLMKYDFVSLGICRERSFCSLFRSDSTIIIDRFDSLIYEKIAAIIDGKDRVEGQEYQYFRNHVKDGKEDMSTVVMFSMIEIYLMALAILLLGTRTKMCILEDFHMRHHQEHLNLPVDEDPENEEVSINSNPIENQIP